MGVLHNRRARRLAKATGHIRAALDEVMPLMRAAFAAVDHNPPPGSSLDQVCLIDGDQVVDDYIRHGEQGLALDHLLYMVEEPPLKLTPTTFEHLAAAAAALGVPSERIAPIRPH